jgi:hypothetical protein
MARHVILLLFLAAAFTGCSGKPTVQTGPGAEVIDGGLYRVDNSRVDMAYVDPDVDFSRYNSVMIDPLGVDNVEIIQSQSGGTIGPRGNRWELTEQDRDDLRRIFAEAMQINLEEKGGYPVVTEPDRGVLRITAALTALEPSAPPDDSRSRGVGRARVYTEGAGTTRIKVAFTDSRSGEVLALVEDRKTSTDLWGVNNRVTNLADVLLDFNGWAREIRAWLDRIHGH